jgi:RNA polymerase sigma-70 factor, ECF subfamily
MRQATDEQLMADIQARDPRAFEELFGRYRELLRARLARVLREDPGAAQDVTQEVFLRAWTRPHQWDGHGPVRAWLLRIGMNLAFNHLRSVRRRRQQPLDAGSFAASSAAGEAALVPRWMVDVSAAMPEVEVEQRERLAMFRRMIDRLPPLKRDAFRLIHEEDMPVAQAAETLGVPPGTVKSRVHYAAKELARALSEMREDWED